MSAVVCNSPARVSTTSPRKYCLYPVHLQFFLSDRATWSRKSRAAQRPRNLILASHPPPSRQRIVFPSTPLGQGASHWVQSDTANFPSIGFILFFPWSGADICGRHPSIRPLPAHNRQSVRHLDNSPLAYYCSPPLSYPPQALFPHEYFNFRSRFFFIFISSFL